MIELRDLDVGELDAARALLSACDLPVDDLADANIALAGAFEGTAMLGVIGLQTCGAIGLLRSLAVDPAHRTRRIARLLCERVIVTAAERNLASVWLLTTTAADYFAKLGFERVARDVAPAELQATQQFSTLCPASAVVMTRADIRIS